jgi:Flp pilus assembly pilin Flp
MRESGQAMVEYAILLPFVLLVVIMPAFHLGLGLSLREELRHAARQAAVAGADEPAVPQRCDTALATVPLILDREPAEVRCSESADALEVYVREPATAVGPFVFIRQVEVTARAVSP